MRRAMILATILSSAVCACGSTSAGRPWTVVNLDCNYYQGSYPDSEMNEEAIVRHVDRYLKGTVTHLEVNPQGQVAVYPSKVIDVCWQAQPWRKESPLERPWVRRTKEMFDRGIDLFAIFMRRAREKGVEPWISMRMNDAHGVWEQDGPGVAKYWRDHPEYWLVPGNKSKDCSRLAFDYAHKAIRDRHIAVAEELLERYDADGFDADWTRFPWHLTPGREKELSPCLTEVMRAIRRKADEMATKRGHPIKVVTTVLSTPETALACGTDVFTWVKEGLVDVVIVANFFSCLNYELPYREWCEKIHALNPNVRVIARMDSSVATCPGGVGNGDRADGAHIRGYVDNLMAQGCRDFGTFNLFAGEKGSERWNLVVEDGLTRERVLRGARKYLTTRPDAVPYGYKMAYPLPARLDGGAEMPVTVGSVENAAEVFVNAGFDADSVSNAVPTLNGVAATSCAPHKPYWVDGRTKSAVRCAFPASALRQGVNKVGFPKTPGVQVRRCEIEVRPGSGDKWTSVPFGKLRTGGEFGRRRQLTTEGNMLKIDTDKTFLEPFVKKDLTRNGKYLGLGKHMLAAVNFAKQTLDPEMIALKDRMVRTVIETQTGDGYLGLYAPQARLDCVWDLHELGYLEQALLAEWREFGNESALAAARKSCDWVRTNWKRLPADWGKTWVLDSMLALGQCRAFLGLYAATGERPYLDFALNERYVPKWNQKLVFGRENMVYGHGYVYCARCMAQHDLMRLQPEAYGGSLFGQSDRATRLLFEGDGALVSGGTGVAECWDAFQTGDGPVCETCTTVYQLFLYDSLLRFGHGDAAYLGDVMERTVWNALFAAQSSDGRKLRYYTPLEGGRNYFQDTYCCPGNFRRGIAELPRWALYTSADGILANLYTPCEAELDVGGARVKVVETTDYPTAGRISFAVEPAGEKEFSFDFRIPGWCKAPRATVNGAPVPDVKPGSLLEVRRVWKKGDVVELDFPMEVRCVRGRKRQAGRFCVLRGPLLYGLATRRAAEEEGQTARAKKRFSEEPASIASGIMIDPRRIALAKGADGTVRPNGTYCEAFSSTDDTALGVPTGPGAVKLRLTEWADPDVTITYFRTPDYSYVKDDDELFTGYRDCLE